MLFLGFALALSLSPGYRTAVAFRVAVQNGDVQRVMDIVNEQGASKLDIDGAFLRAASNGHVGVMEFLMEKGASDVAGALVCAAIRNQMRTVKYLAHHPNTHVDRMALKFAAVAAGNNDAIEVELFLMTKLRHGLEY
jgi:hypothetical protein